MAHPLARLESLYHAARLRPPDERTAFLAEACGGDEDLRREVESLLAEHAATGGFLAGVAAYAPTLAAGMRIGVYTIAARIGAGGMGEVYRARDSRLGRDVAIKALPPQFATDPERRARFAREARLLATLNHPHIGAIYGLEEIADQTVLVLEHVDGPTLAERLEHGPMAVGEALAVARQIADALDAAHQKNIIHRDLKPANIVLNNAANCADPRVKVLDFGLATIRASDGADNLDRMSITERGTEAGRILGTPAYMSPEQARGQAVDKRADIWAFGCVLFEMLTGRSPFGGETVTDTLAQILEREPEWDSVPARTSAPVRMLLHRCLRKDPERRLRDIGDARIELDDENLIAVATEPDKAPHIPLFAWIAGALLISAVFAAGAFLRPRPALPVVDRMTLTIGPPSDAKFFSRSGAIALSPDGTHLATMAYTGSVPRLWVRPLETLDWRAIQGTEGAYAPFWKADSREIGFFVNGKIRAVPLREGGIPYDICDAPTGFGYYAGAAWNRDDVIVFMSNEYRLQKVSAKGGVPPQPVTTLRSGETSHRWPSFLPDGRHFLYLALVQSGDAGELHVASIDGVASDALGPAESNAIYSKGHLLFVKGDRLVAQPFDVTSRHMTGDPFALAMTIQVMPGLGSFADFSAAESGAVVYRAARHQRLTWRDRAGTFLGTVWNQGLFYNLDLSQDGLRLAVSATIDRRLKSDIWIGTLATGNFSRLTTDPAQEYDPRWSPGDGRTIAFLSDRGSKGWRGWRRASDGSGTDEPLIPDHSQGSVSSWTPDGHSFLSTDGTENIWIVPLDGTRKRIALRRTEGQKYAVVLSPDGRWITYMSDKTGRNEIYVRAFPDGETEYKISQDGGLGPRWSTDGKEIFFIAINSLDANMMAARVETSRGFSATTPAVLFPTGLQELPNRFPYVVDRNGRFLMPVDPQGPAPVTVLLNWDAKLPK